MVSSPKKRGRKPKTKDDKIENKEPKKRGRKPKPKPDDNSKSSRKRGRKPKEKIYSVSKPVLNKNESEEENIILHLPINSSDITDSNMINTSFEYDPHFIPEVQPYDSSNNTYQVIDQDSEINTYENFEPIIKEESKEISVNKKEMEEKEVPIEAEEIDFDKEKYLVKRNIINIQYEFIDCKNRKIWPTSTNIHCMWCCHQFDNTPIAIPDKCINCIFYVLGCFCSFNCAAAFSFDKKDYAIWERYSLLHSLRKKLYPNDKKKNKIKLAPERRVLKMFGGSMTIEEFRLNFVSLKSYNIIEPPMISVIPKIEENIYETTKKDQKFIPVDQNLIQSVTMKLKRDKPLTNSSNTLESFMG